MCICIWLRARAYICISLLLIIELVSITSFFICELLLYYYSLFYLYLYIFSFSSNIVVLNTLLRYYGELCSIIIIHYVATLYKSYSGVIPGCLRWIVSTNTAFVRVERVLPYSTIIVLVYLVLFLWGCNLQICVFLRYSEYRYKLLFVAFQILIYISIIMFYQK